MEEVGNGHEKSLMMASRLVFVTIVLATVALMAKLSSYSNIYPVLKLNDVKQIIVDNEHVHAENGKCTKILLHLQDTYTRNSVCCQMNNYLLAALMAMFTNRSLVPFSNINTKAFNTSQFGCPRNLAIERCQSPTWFE
jgi:hypothetical protein